VNVVAAPSGSAETTEPAEPVAVAPTAG